MPEGHVKAAKISGLMVGGLSGRGSANALPRMDRYATVLDTGVHECRCRAQVEHGEHGELYPGRIGVGRCG